MLLAKIGFTAAQVAQMSAVEAQSWLAVYLESQGIKPATQDGKTTHYIIQRKKRA
ncbi:hypothetical protein [Gallibacterium anatis]|uniref:hypothetical protein n=1 Tax=Gallibacterium anatis TaxID=750 RepID=UPI003004BAB9